MWMKNPMKQNITNTTVKASTTNSGMLSHLQSTLPNTAAKSDGGKAIIFEVEAAQGLWPLTGLTLANECAACRLSRSSGVGQSLPLQAQQP